MDAPIRDRKVGVEAHRYRAVERIVDMRNGAGVVAILVLIAAGGVAAQQDKKKKPTPAAQVTIKSIMLGSHKEKGALVFRVRDAESTEEDNKKLLEEYKLISTMKPPLGDPKSWANRTGNAIAALQELVNKKSDGAVERVRGATECSGCHNAHRVGGNK